HGTILWCGGSVCAGIAPSVDKQILAGDETSVLRAQKCAISAELVRPALAPGGVGLGARTAPLLACLSACLEHGTDVAPLRVAVEDARQEIVDGDVAGGGLSRKPSDETHEPGTRAIRQAELQLRHLHAARDDVDDAAEPARHHAVHGEPHHLD